jgi:hypothetical protein
LWQIQGRISDLMKGRPIVGGEVEVRLKGKPEKTSTWIPFLPSTVEER